MLAESDDTVVVKRNHYFPPEAIQNEFFVPNGHTSVCPWKGTAHYYSRQVAVQVNENAAWYYPEPLHAAEEIRGRVAFWKGVEVAE